MRIITGTAKGRKLKSVEGLDTRPTSDRTKESIFNIIQFDIEGRHVLDLFAGTGQMGLEALSRGALTAEFVDIRPECVKVIKENIEKTGFIDRTKVMQTDFENYLKRARPRSFGLIFLDPPYGEGFMERALELIASRDLLCEGGLILCEGVRTDEVPVLEKPYRQGREYIYGKSRIQLYIKSTLDGTEDDEL
ncbi:MAG: 16S rRNA (guanine(966)-N(2))-methyltransferase RsmD [Clostridiales bacterium]|nr:16S rRNA (guanine(966)-N(2))-methyltransferase RsmD [Clostridiales bacterium]